MNPWDDPLTRAVCEKYPPRILITTVPCPVCRKKAWLDLVDQTGTCRNGHRITGAQVMVGGQPLAWPCPVCGRDLYPWQETVQCVCGWEGSRSALEDETARRVMEEEPNGATIYRKPRHGRKR